ncbi:MAG: TRAP transporter large permease [Desulfobacterales bacterium]
MIIPTYILIIGIISLLTGVSLYAGLGYSAALSALAAGIPIESIIAASVGSLHREVWLAIPLFILSGYLMIQGSSMERMIKAINSMVGWVPGGLALVMVLTCAFFGACSGSIVSAVAAVGSIMIPMMKEEGYDAAWSAALVAVAGVLGMLIPPSNPFIIYCGITETPVGKMFMAGIIPGIIFVFMLYFTILLFPKGRVRSRKKYTWIERKKAIIEALPLFGVPISILGGIYSGIATAVEAAAFGCLYAAMIGIFVYRQLSLPGIIDSLRNATRITCMIFLLVAMAYSINAVATMLALPTTLASSAIGLGKIGLMMMVVGILLLTGFVLEEISTMVVMVPIFWPSVVQLGIDPLHFGVVVCTAASIGYCTPPVALNLYTAASVGNVRSTAVFWQIIPFLICIIILNIITVLFPQLSTWLPGLIY